MTNPRAWTRTRWCSTCRRSVTLRVEMLTPIPPRDPERQTWIEAAIRESEAKFQNEHAAACGRTT